MAKTLFKNGELVLSDGRVKADMVVDGGKIVDVALNISGDFDEEVDCSGKVVMPGLIDVHVHFREPGAAYKEDWETGSKAAAAGGVTTVFDMPNNNPSIVTLETLEEKRKLILGRSYVNYGLYMGYNGENHEEINKAEGITGVKIYCAHSTGKMGVATDHIEGAFRRIDDDKLLLFHAEDEECIAKNREEILGRYEEGLVPPLVHSEIRAPECAVKMVKFICELAAKYHRKIHICHVSTNEEVEIINEYKNLVTCEVSPHHLLLSDDDYDHLGNFIKVNPPVRSRMDVFSLWKHLKMGMIDIIATDHAPHTIEEKEQPYTKAPSGVPGVEMMLPILLNTVNSEGMTMAELVQLCCEGPAKLFGIKGKGKIEPGYDADFVIVDMDLEKKVENKNVFSKCGWTPYAGSVFQGWPVKTYVNGKLVFEEGEFVGKPEGNNVRLGR